MDRYSGTDGVGEATSKGLIPGSAFKLRRYSDYVLSRHEDSSRKPRVLVGHDTHIPGEMLEQALVARLLSVEVEVFQLGVISTPGVAYLTRLQEASAGVMISASRNPVEDNGIKFFRADDFRLADDQEAEIEASLDAKEDTLPRSSAEGLGSLDEFPEGLLKYSRFLVQSISGDLADIIVCLDVASGATAATASRVFMDSETGFYTVGTSPSELNINDGVGSTHPEALAEMAVEKGTDAGLAFDGDGDRIIAVDELGRIIDGDRIMYICTKCLAERKRLKKDTAVTAVTGNLGFHRVVEEIDLKDVVTQVGDRYVVEKMRKNDYNSGGERSGYMIFLDYNTAGDGILSGIRLLSVTKQTGKELPELANEVTICPQKLVDVRATDENDAVEVPAIKTVIEQTEVGMNGEGRILARSSGTEPSLRMMAGAPAQEKVDYYADKIVEAIRARVGAE